MIKLIRWLGLFLKNHPSSYFKLVVFICFLIHYKHYKMCFSISLLCSLLTTQPRLSFWVAFYRRRLDHSVLWQVWRPTFFLFFSFYFFLYILFLDIDYLNASSIWPQCKMKPSTFIVDVSLHLGVLWRNTLGGIDTGWADVLIRTRWSWTSWIWQKGDNRSPNGSAYKPPSSKKSLRRWNRGPLVC